MNRVGNICNAYNHTWVILAGKKLSQHDKTSAVNNFIALNEGRIDFKTGGPVVFDLDTMEPVSDTGDASSGTPGTFLQETLNFPAPSHIFSSSAGSVAADVTHI